MLGVKMAFEELTICAKHQVRKVVKRFAATHLLSLVDPDDRVRTPNRIARENHLSIRFDDVESPHLPFAPTYRRLETAAAWVDRLPNDARLVIQCTAGISRSTAVAFAFLCRKMDVEAARDRLLEISPEASPNALITALMDRMFDMDGALHNAAFEIRMRDARRPIPNLDLQSLFYSP